MNTVMNMSVRGRDDFVTVQRWVGHECLVLVYAPKTGAYMLGVFVDGHELEVEEMGVAGSFRDALIRFVERELEILIERLEGSWMLLESAEYADERREAEELIREDEEELFGTTIYYVERDKYPELKF